MSNNQNQRQTIDFSQLLEGAFGGGGNEFNPIALFFSMPIIVMAIITLIWEFLKQPNAEKIKQLAAGCFYLIAGHQQLQQHP